MNTTGRIKLVQNIKSGIIKFEQKQNSLQFLFYNNRGGVFLTSLVLRYISPPLQTKGKGK